MVAASEAQAELRLAADKSLELIWVGSVAPPSSWRVFERPISWHEVIEAMDELFAPAGSLDLDLGLGPTTSPATPPTPCRPDHYKRQRHTHGR